MNKFLDFVLLFLSQFSGGPSAPENNLVRFGLATIFWGGLFAFAWSRRRNEGRPREQLLIYGFALGLFRELLMLGHASLRLLFPDNYQFACMIMEPIEHAMMLAMVVVISGSFLGYILDDTLLAKRFLRIGLALAAIEYLVTLIWWPNQVGVSRDFRFHQSWSAWLIHLIACIVIVVAIAILVQKRGWLRNVIILALSSFLVSEFLVLINLTLDSRYKNILCPVANTFYIWAIPLFGYVYFRELSIEKREAENALQAHRQHLEEMVAARTSELMRANKKLRRAAVVEERQRMASEMHDGLAQTLTYLLMKTDKAVEVMQDGRSDQLVTLLSHMHQAIDQASVDVRRVIASLAEAPQPNQSLQDLLCNIINQVKEDDGLLIRLEDHTDAPIFLNSAEREQVSRIVHEALLNAVHHAQAREIVVQLEAKSSTRQIVVVDNGRGFDPDDNSARRKDHFGLNIMRARAAQLDGRFSIQSTPGLGTRVTLSWSPVGDLKHGNHQKQVAQPDSQPVIQLSTG